MYKISAVAPHSIVPATIEGVNCYRLMIKPDDAMKSGTISAQFDGLDKFYEGRNSKWRFSVYFPSGLEVTPDNPYKFAGIHSEYFQYKILDFHVYGDQVRVTITPEINGEVPVSKKYYTDIIYDTWMDFEVAYLISKGDDGRFSVYLNGSDSAHRIAFYRGPTMYPNEPDGPGRGQYWQVCVYDNQVGETETKQRYLYANPFIPVMNTES